MCSPVFDESVCRNYEPDYFNNYTTDVRLIVQVDAQKYSHHHVGEIVLPTFAVYLTNNVQIIAGEKNHNSDVTNKVTPGIVVIDHLTFLMGFNGGNRCSITSRSLQIAFLLASISATSF